MPIGLIWEYSAARKYARLQNSVVDQIRDQCNANLFFSFFKKKKKLLLKCLASGKLLPTRATAHACTSFPTSAVAGAHRLTWLTEVGKLDCADTRGSFRTKYKHLLWYLIIIIFYTEYIYTYIYLYIYMCKYIIYIHIYVYIYIYIFFLSEHIQDFSWTS